MVTGVKTAEGVSRFDYGPVGMREERHHIVFDIETGPQSPQDLNRMMPSSGFTAKANLVDPKKIAADIMAKEDAFRDRAALSPSTGQVIAIGVRVKGENIIFHQGEISRDNESKVLDEFFAFFRKHHDQRWIGWSSHQFDWQFLRKRAWVHGLHFPSGIYDGIVGAKWLNFHKNILDAQLAWDEGNHMTHTRLDTASKTLGLTGKTGSGGNFFKLYKTDQEAALDYLGHDLELTDQVWEIIG